MKSSHIISEDIFLEKTSATNNVIKTLTIFLVPTIPLIKRKKHFSKMMQQHFLINRRTFSYYKEKSRFNKKIYEIQKKIEKEKS
jgi:hypothetical protein